MPEDIVTRCHDDMRASIHYAADAYWRAMLFAMMTFTLRALLRAMP